MPDPSTKCILGGLLKHNPVTSTNHITKTTSKLTKKFLVQEKTLPLIPGQEHCTKGTRV